MNHLLLTIFTIFFYAATINIHAETWQTYENPTCGYTLHYPGTATVEPKTELTALTYHDPFDLLKSLLNDNPKYKAAYLEKNCGISVKLPIEGEVGKINLLDKWLFVYVLNNVPKQDWPPKVKGWGLHGINGQLIKIGKQKYYQVFTDVGGMSKDLYTQYYFLKHENRYYILMFVLDTVALGVQDGVDTAFDAKLETKDFNRILSEFTANIKY